MKGKKTGGRVKAVPNKPKHPCKEAIEQENIAYFTPRKVKIDGEWRMMSKCQQDLEELSPAERVKIEVQMLEYHMAKLKAIDATVSAQVHVNTIEDKLRALCAGEELDADDTADD